jgi:[acyl-carrier-protein] S-malonyltransferase
VKVAFLFPGQGSQAVGMGADLAAHLPVAMSTFDDASLQLGYKLDSLCFYGPADKLGQTDLTQPALYTVSVAALRALTEAGVRAEAAAGHSVGEYAALYSAGVFDFATGLRLVNMRGLAMSRAAAANPGAMSAVLGLEADVVAECCSSVSAGEFGLVTAANFNGGGQVVISGTVSAVETVSELLKERGAKRVIRIPVSGAFHSPLMKNATEEMKVYLEGAQFDDAKLPVVANFTANYEISSDEIKANLIAQIESPVRWEESMKTLLDDNFDVFVEIGSGTVLSGLMKRILKDVQILNVADAAGVANVVSALKN